MDKVSCWYSGLQTHGETCDDCRHGDECEAYTALEAARREADEHEDMISDRDYAIEQAEQERDELREAVVYCGSEEMLKAFLDTYREKAPTQHEDPK